MSIRTRVVFLLVLWSAMPWAARVVACFPGWGARVLCREHTLANVESDGLPGWVVCGWCHRRAYVVVRAYALDPREARRVEGSLLARSKRLGGGSLPGLTDGDSVMQAGYLQSQTIVFAYSGAVWPPPVWPQDEVSTRLARKLGASPKMLGDFGAEVQSATLFLFLSGVMTACTLVALLRFQHSNSWSDVRGRGQSLRVLLGTVEGTMIRSLVFAAIALPILMPIAGVLLSVGWAAACRPGVDEAWLGSTLGWPFVGAYGLLLAVPPLLIGRGYRVALAGVLGPEGVYCFRCDYALRGITSDRCPECGSSVQACAEPVAVRLPRRSVLICIVLGVVCQAAVLWMACTPGFGHWLHGVVMKMW